MSEPIVSKERIAQQAFQAAQDMDACKPAPNPYPTDTEAHRYWQVSLYWAQMDLSGELTA